MKKIFLVILLFNSFIIAQGFQLGEARGLFISVGVGPKIPIGDFSSTNSLGVGLILHSPIQTINFHLFFLILN